MMPSQPESAPAITPNPLRTIPSVERVLHALETPRAPTAAGSSRDPATNLPRPLVVAEVRRVLADLRRKGEPADFAGVMRLVHVSLERLRRTQLQVVINGTGVLLHTNFGRAPLGETAVQAVAAVAANYSNLEFDLDRGERGGRAAYLERALSLLCAAEAATVVNNCAAALVLVLRHCTATRREVVISRGELIQIGGGFRIPEILEASGAVLREVGTTNQTALEDYAQALTPATGLILKVHRSNFFMEGFVASPGTEALAALAHEHGIPLLEDVGSGAVFPTERLGTEHEPTPAELLRAGVDLVTFSGDKLLGGPQAGIIAGKAGWIAALKQEPLFRALRCDKLVFAALQAAVDAHLSGEAETMIPFQELARAPVDALRVRAGNLVAALAGLALDARAGTVESEIGGGSLPRSRLPSIALELQPQDLPLAEFSARLARHEPPVIGTIAHDRLRLDLRTVFPRQDPLVLEAIRAALRRPQATGEEAALHGPR